MMIRARSGIYRVDQTLRSGRKKAAQIKRLSIICSDSAPVIMSASLKYFHLKVCTRQKSSCFLPTTQPQPSKTNWLTELLFTSRRSRQPGQQPGQPARAPPRLRGVPTRGSLSGLQERARQQQPRRRRDGRAGARTRHQPPPQRARSARAPRGGAAARENAVPQSQPRRRR
jgi:hypothetical protein